MPYSPAGLKTYLKEISRHQVLSREEESGLFDRLRGGDECARERIVSCNLRLVVRLAKQFLNKGLSLEDLVQEGNMGLIEVVNRFDHTLGFRFSTYAAFWIRQAMQVAVRKQGSLIRLPVRKTRQLGHMNEIVQEYQSLRGRAPTYDELAERMKISRDQVHELAQISKTAISLDAPIDEDGGNLQERLADAQVAPASRLSMEREMVRKVRQTLSQLSRREHCILGLRFGLHGQSTRSLRGISRRVGLSQEGVRRIEQRALAKLSRSHLRRQLVGLL